MEEIIIRDKNTNILLYIDNHNYYGYVFKEDNTIYNVDKSIFKYFDLLKLSPNHTKIGTQNEYEIFLDNKTGLNHYLHNGTDNIEMLLLNNGIPAILYKDYHDNLQNRKLDQIILEIKGIIIGGTILGLLLSYQIRALELMVKPPESISRIVFSEYSNFNLKDAHDLIYLSPNLTEEEKNLLYNEDLLNDIFNTIDNHYFEKFSLKRSLTDIGIKSYNDKNRPYKNGDNQIIGYYNANPGFTNTIHVLNYNGLNEDNINILTHEFIHLCQEHSCTRTVIQEACAEIISKEYNKYSIYNSYYNQVKSVKILMEIIGPEPIWHYTFTGDFSQIEEKVKPYLTSKEYDEFLTDLVYSPKNNDINEKRTQSLDNILSTLYKNIYGEDINNNEIISLINNYTPIVRYYFNSRFINEENSYYITKEKTEMSLEEAVKLGVIEAHATRERELSHEEILKYIQNNEIIINRQIDYTNTSINIEKETIKDNKLYITGTINGTHYEDTNIDELYQLGYINVTYTIKEKKILTYEEYTSEEAKQYEIEYSANINTIKYKDHVTTFVNKKVYIPPINTNQKTLTKK